MIGVEPIVISSGISPTASPSHLQTPLQTSNASASEDLDQTFADAQRNPAIPVLTRVVELSPATRDTPNSGSHSGFKTVQIVSGITIAVSSQPELLGVPLLSDVFSFDHHTGLAASEKTILFKAAEAHPDKIERIGADDSISANAGEVIENTHDSSIPIDQPAEPTYIAHNFNQEAALIAPTTEPSNYQLNDSPLVSFEQLEALSQWSEAQALLTQDPLPALWIDDVFDTQASEMVRALDAIIQQHTTQTPEGLATTSSEHDAAIMAPQQQSLESDEASSAAKTVLEHGFDRQGVADLDLYQSILSNHDGF